MPISRGGQSVHVHLANVSANQSVGLECWIRIPEVSTRPGVTYVRECVCEIYFNIFSNASVHSHEYDPCL